MFSGTVGTPLNNALNLFPSTTTPQQTQLKLQRLFYAAYNNARGPTDIQTTLARSLYDDGVQYMNTLEMNRAASYTFGYRNSYGQNGTTLNDLGGNTHGISIASEMWELVVDLTLSKYSQHSVLALTKTIHLIQHVLLHGSESCVLNGELLYRIEMAVQPLQNLNTALVEQQMVEQILGDNGRATGENDVVLTSEGIGQQLAQFGTKATATMLKLRGGSADKGHPVRQAAKKLYDIVSVSDRLRQMRLQQQQQQQPGGSLVPIGSTNQVGYITDEARLRLLQQKMAEEEQREKQKRWAEEQKLKQTRSNLAGKSAVDSFGGGYAGGGGRVVGAANSLEDMIRSARYELEQHKTRRGNKITSLKKGYSDDPSARAQQLRELERANLEDDPEFARKEKALKDALEYLEEMQREQQEKVGDLLEGDLLGDPGTRCAVPDSGTTTAGSNAGADLLGFDNNPTPAPDVFGGSPAMTMPSNNAMSSGGGGSADLLGFDGLSGGMGSAQPMPPANNTMPGYMMGGHTNNMQINMNSPAPATMGMNGIMGNNFDMRPSLVTGMRGDDTGTNDLSNLNVVGGPSSQQQRPLHSATGYSDNVGTTAVDSLQPPTELDEKAESENLRKMQMAAGLFAGVVPTSNESDTAPAQKKPIMESANSSNVSALDDLIPVFDTSALAPSNAAPADNTSAYAARDTNSLVMPSSDPFAMGPMGGQTGMGDLSMGAGSGAPMPSMAPPPPPMEPPPPPPPPASAATLMPAVPAMTPTVMPNNPIGGNGNNALGANPSVDQMQEMIKQQQAQMNQMMQMMQQMQMQGGNTNNGAPMGGWPPS